MHIGRTGLVKGVTEQIEYIHSLSGIQLGDAGGTRAQRRILMKPLSARQRNARDAMNHLLGRDAPDVANVVDEAFEQVDVDAVLDGILGDAGIEEVHPQVGGVGDVSLGQATEEDEEAAAQASDMDIDGDDEEVGHRAAGYSDGGAVAKRNGRATWRSNGRHYSSCC